MAKTLKFQNGDMVRSYLNSSYNYVEDKEKVRQDVKLILTSGVRKSTGLGCGLDEVLGAMDNNPMYAYAQFPIVFEFQTRLRVGISRLKAMQRRKQIRQRTPGELIFDFTPAEVWMQNEDPRNYKWSVNILTEDGKSNFSIGGAARL